MKTGGKARMPKDKNFAPMSSKDKNYIKNGPQGGALTDKTVKNLMLMIPRSGAGAPGAMPMTPKPAPMPMPPKSMGQGGDNYFPDIYDSAVKAALMNSGVMGGMPPTMQNKGAYGGFESNYFPEARPNMPIAPGAQGIQGALPNMGKAQGNPDNYFREARPNIPKAAPQSAPVAAQAPQQQKAMIPRSKTRSPGIALDGSRIKY